ncbi:hypothetical protein BUE80_DR009033 [Diplocarpon rosae]|nr:hypothetical protein BUE80_DR009033 [Diplocarpon rosae]
MDDPWGSPWADEIQIPASIKTKEDVIRPTPLARASAWEEKLNSPWGDDYDGRFRDWTVFSEDTNQTSRVDGAADGWDRHDADSHEQTLALSDHWRMRSTVGYGESSKLAPSILAKSAESSRHPPSDPWALNRHADKGEPEGIHDPSNNMGKEVYNFTLIREPDQQPTKKQLPNLHHETLLSGHSKEKSVPVRSVPERDTRVEDKAVLATTIPADASIEAQDSYTVSRLSSSPSEHSHHEEPSQESPWTSFDEEPKASRFQTQRKASAKIQSLVEHFDGLAKKGVTEPVIRSSSAQEPNQDGDEGDFGDFEEGLSDGKSDIQDIGFLQGETQYQAIDNLQQCRFLDVDLKKNHGSVEFVLDIARLETIFSSDIPESTCAKIFIADSIPFDSFSSTEERKTWYRISRYGTIRKYNSGNDEDYVRVAWKQSNVRGETLKIVSRWIEEDRTSGRVVLGRGGRGSSAFEWNDSKAPAVSLAQAFSKHRKQKSVAAVAASVDVPREWPTGLVRDRSTSKTLSPPNMSRQRSSLQEVSVSSEANRSLLTPLSNFEWKEGSKSTELAHGSVISGGKLSGPVVKAAPLSDSPALPRTVVSPHNISIIPDFAPSYIAPHEKPIAPRFGSDDQQAPKTPNLSSLAGSNLVDEDDDWGDMVSSPATPTLPALLPQKGLRHKKSQSFGGMRSDASQTSKGSAWTMEALQPGLSSRATTSFDNFLVPTSANLQKTHDINLSTASPLEIFSTPMDSLKAASDAPPAASYDPWATADFSFFDTAPAPVQKSIPMPTPKAARLSTSTPAPLQGNQRSWEDLEQDRIVQAVVKALPDLSYMLRK